MDWLGARSRDVEEGGRGGPSRMSAPYPIVHEIVRIAEILLEVAHVVRVERVQPFLKIGDSLPVRRSIPSARFPARADGGKAREGLGGLKDTDRARASESVHRDAD